MTAPTANPGRGSASYSTTSAHSRAGNGNGHKLWNNDTDFGDDTGDISLSLGPRSGLGFPIAAAERQPPRPRDVSTPAPQRLLGKGLLEPHASGVPQRSASAAPSTPHREQGSSVERPLSAVQNGTRHPSSTSTATSSAHPPSTPTISINTPTSLAARRPGVTRSRSLSVKIPTVDLASRGNDPASATVTSSATTSAGPFAKKLLDPNTSSPLVASPRPPPLVDDDCAQKMSRWVKEIVVCNFDLERGPVVERRAVGRRWGTGEKENVAFSSFPDTSLFTEGSIQFSFKIRHLPPDPSSLAFPEPPSPLPDRTDEPVLGRRPGHARGVSLSREKAAEYRNWDERGREWLYGFVWFHQRRDRGIARGFMQKSVVILTHLPFPQLFSAVLGRVAPSFFQYGYSALEVACHAIASWPDPVPDAQLELPLLSEVLTVKLPDSTDNPQVDIRVNRNEPGPLLASLPSSSPLRTFASFLPSLWSIWECLVLAEPVLIIAPDPRTCSEIVWWLREIVRPIPLAGDFRPYLHIHDHDFSLLVNASKPQAGVVVGVTNPFFRNAASHWPNVISVPSDRPRPQVPGGPRTETPEGFLSRRHRSVQKDRALLKRLEGLVAEGKFDDPEGNDALRTHFRQLTEKMLVPLNRYFQTLVPPRTPVPTSPQPGRSAVPPPPPALSLSTLKPFSLPAFVSHLKTKGPNPLSFKTKGLSTKSRVESDFYSSFCMSPCFASWLSARVESLGIAVASNLKAMGLEGVPSAIPRRLSPAPSDMASTSTRSSQEGSGKSGPASARASIRVSADMQRHSGGADDVFGPVLEQRRLSASQGVAAGVGKPKLGR